ncbi:MAG: hypothetical protein ACLPSW_02410 [Roseiarcus sp.]
MSEDRPIDYGAIRTAMAGFELSPRVEPNEIIEINRAFFPDSHRGVLDLRRQLVVGNRGMGKSFWTHALLNPDLRTRIANVYSFSLLANTDVVVGFNGSTRTGNVAPTIDEVEDWLKTGGNPEQFWRAVVYRAAYGYRYSGHALTLDRALRDIIETPRIYSEVLTTVDDQFARDGKSLLVVFDALDRLARDWKGIRALAQGLLILALGLQSFRSIRTKIFVRPDLFADSDLFRFPDSSKLKNDRVDMAWKPRELFGLLLYELLRQPDAVNDVEGLAASVDLGACLPREGRLTDTNPEQQPAFIAAIAGEFMGASIKRGRVYSWVPLHLSDSASNCSPRTFLTAWKSAAEHGSQPIGLVVDHLGLIEGVRRASSARLEELREDYPWIDSALKPLGRQFVPMERQDLFALWDESGVVNNILSMSERGGFLPPFRVPEARNNSGLLAAMVNIAVMEERANGKINVPDIFRVEAGILRKGGVAVPRRGRS